MCADVYCNLCGIQQTLAYILEVRREVVHTMQQLRLCSALTHDLIMCILNLWICGLVVISDKKKLYK